MMRTILICLFAGILLAMLVVTTYASLDRAVWSVGPPLTSDPWFHATLADAYFGFLTFYVWVAYKEPTLWRKIVWFLLIMMLGNIAMAAYMLIQLSTWDVKRGVEGLLLRSSPAS